MLYYTIIYILNTQIQLNKIKNKESNARGPGIKLSSSITQFAYQECFILIYIYQEFK